jgi:hypothetical protein
MKLPLVLAVAVAPALVHAQTFYSTDFSGAVGPEWSNTTTSTTPIGDRPFLGEFGNTAVTLNLTGLPAHDTVTISFDLFVIRSMDGNSEPFPFEQDHWRISIGDAASQSVILDTTFSNADSIPRSQFYPDPFSAGINNPARTGASESNTLGYLHFGDPMDTVYNLSLIVPHTADTFSAVFEGYDLQALADESWGIANVEVMVIPTPVPETGEYAAVFVIGLAGIFAWRRRSRPQAGTVQAA